MCSWPLSSSPILVTFGQICNFRDPNLVTFYFYELTHFLDWMKNTLLFIYSTNILVRLLTVNMKNCLTPKTMKMCDPILVTLLKVRPHYSQSSGENVTPSSGTSPQPPSSWAHWDPHTRALWKWSLIKGAVSWNSAKLGNYKMPVILAET